MTHLNLDAVHDVMVSVAYEAGRMILAADPASIDMGTKLNCTLVSWAKCSAADR